MSMRLAKIRADLRRIASAFDMTSDGLGDALCDSFIDGVKGCIAREEAPDGEPWDQLDPDYEAWKSQRFPGKPMGFLMDIMADESEIAGEREIAPEEATATYGKSDEAKDHAYWFQRGDEENNRPARPFWGFTKDSRSAAKSILSARLKKVVNG